MTNKYLNIFLNTSVLYTFKYYAIKCGGEGGSQNMILYDTGEGGGLERGQIVLHNT